MLKRREGMPRRQGDAEGRGDAEGVRGTLRVRRGTEGPVGALAGGRWGDTEGRGER